METGPTGKPTRVWPVAVTVALGVLLGLAGYTFRYAEGLSYFETDPKACVNCHIMRLEYDAWQKASHHGVATCVDCHIPQGFFAKYMTKASNGWHHSKGFTLQDFHEPIQIKSINATVLQENCLRCHRPLVEPLLAGAKTGDSAYCVHCHATVGHGEKVGLGGRLRPDEVAASPEPETRRAP